jgi:hypothetical protein
VGVNKRKNTDVKTSKPDFPWQWNEKKTKARKLMPFNKRRALRKRDGEGK